MTQIKHQLTDDQWQRIDAALKHFMQSVELQIDGYQVVLCLERVSQFHNGITVHINGSFKGQWGVDFMNGHGEGFEIIRRFYPTRKRSVWTSEQKKQLVRIYGKRCAQKEHGLDKTVEIPGAYWSNFNSLKRQLIKENHSIQLIEGSIAA